PLPREDRPPLAPRGLGSGGLEHLSRPALVPDDRARPHRPVPLDGVGASLRRSLWRSRRPRPGAPRTRWRSRSACLMREAVGPSRPGRGAPHVVLRGPMWSWRRGASWCLGGALLAALIACGGGRAPFSGPSAGPRQNGLLITVDPLPP